MFASPMKATKFKKLILGSLTPPYELGKNGHLFERIHHKDPFMQVLVLEKLGAGSTKYTVSEIK